MISHVVIGLCQCAYKFYFRFLLFEFSTRLLKTYWRQLGSFLSIHKHDNEDHEVEDLAQISGADVSDPDIIGTSYLMQPKSIQKRLEQLVRHKDSGKRKEISEILLLELKS